MAEELLAIKELDLRFHELESMEDIVTQYCKDHCPAALADPEKLRRCNAVMVRLGSNNLCNIQQLADTLDRICVLSEVKILDLSCNEIDGFQRCFDDPRFNGLMKLYLHGNAFGNLENIIYLRHLPALQALSMHGTPMSDKANYRALTLSTLLQLKTLDMVPITHAERASAAAWRKMTKVRLQVSQQVEPTDAD